MYVCAYACLTELQIPGDHGADRACHMSCKAAAIAAHMYILCRHVLDLVHVKCRELSHHIYI